MPSLTPLNQQNVEYPFPGNPPPLYIGFSWPPLKVRFFQWTPKILKFLSLNTILSFKVTKILVKISQFESLVMTEKNIFAHKHFLSLNISDFNLFFMWKLQTPPQKKVTPLFPSNLPLKAEVLSSPLFENLVGVSTSRPPPPPPPSRKGGEGGAHYGLNNFIFYQQYRKGHSMFQADQLFPILEQQLKPSLHFLVFIYNQ